MTRYFRSIFCPALLVCAATALAQPSSPKANEWTGTTEQKVWGLMTVWAQAKYTFPHFDRMPGLNWDQTVQEYIPRAIAAEDMDAYYQVLLELVALLKDGHTSILPPWGYLKPGYDLAPIEVRVLGDHFYVDRVGDTAELPDQKIRPGVEILAVEGVPVGRYFAENVLRYHSENTKQGDESFFIVYLLYGPAGEQMTLKIQELDGAVRDVSVTRNAMSGDSPFMTRLMANALVDTTIKTKMLPGGIQYVEIPNFEHKQASEDFVALIDNLDETTVKGRYNTGGASSIVKPMVACLIDQTVTSPTMKFRHFIGAYEAWGREPIWETASDQIHPRDGKRYLGPLVVLTGGLTNSSSEDFAIELHAGGRATLVGQITGGSAGNALISSLPGGGTLRIATFTALIPGGEEYVGVGVVPDVEVWPTREDLAAGRDAVLERAMELLAD
ncbi:MAG: S41 family peptidase [Candidatus Krumholzibacteria bacterium]|nr:S41 family peptidase [Candidatus Krumholzibacteria bacterium]